MANSNPHHARAQKKRNTAQSAGSPDDLRAVLWQAISVAVDIIRDPDARPDIRLRATHAITQASGVYTKVYEATEFDARLRTLEEAREHEGTTL